jgi:hypothetical protein
MANALDDVSCVVSALNGLRDVIIDRQTILLNAAVKAGVPRFISSDYSEDFTTTTPGDNRNLDLRREFMVIADHAPITVTSILDGAFMDMLGAEMPIIQKGLKRVLYWHAQPSGWILPRKTMLLTIPQLLRWMIKRREFSGSQAIA